MDPWFDLVDPRFGLGGPPVFFGKVGGPPVWWTPSFFGSGVDGPPVWCIPGQTGGPSRVMDPWFARPEKMDPVSKSEFAVLNRSKYRGI